jgi:hypothetical protein
MQNSVLRIHPVLERYLQCHRVRVARVRCDVAVPADRRIVDCDEDAVFPPLDPDIGRRVWERDMCESREKGDVPRR